MSAGHTSSAVLVYPNVESERVSVASSFPVRCQPPTQCPGRLGSQLASKPLDRISSAGCSGGSSRLRVIVSAPTFEELGLHETAQLCFVGREQFFARNDFVYHQGETRTQVSLVLAGAVKLTRGTRQGHEVVLGVKSTGELLDPNYTSGRTQTAAIALEHSKLLSWDIEALSSLLERSKPLQRNFVRAIVSQLHEIQESFCDLATMNVAVRVARVLIRTQRAISATPRRAPITLSREELAQMAGTTVFAVSRLVTHWGRQGLVDARRRAVRVKDESALLQAAEQNEMAA